jgi:hypothetical protein
MVELEKRGVATVSLTAKGFIRDSRRSAETFGLPQAPIAVVSLPFTNQMPGAVDTMIDACLDQIVDGLTKPLPDVRPEAELVTRAEEWLEFVGEDLLDAVDAMNREFLRYGWSDGFPLRAPDERAMAAMLAGTKLSPETVIATLEPGFGIATVEKIAANAVMAGCRPDHLPVVIAAVRCLAEPKMYLRNKAMSTGPHAPLVLVNGPIRSRIGINSGRCALGPGSPSYANTAIGRALRLCMMNVGHAYPDVSDLDTIGSPTKYSMCAGENEESSPWTPYHVELGHKADVSTVTVLFSYGICELHDFVSQTPERLIEVFASAAMNVAQVPTGMWLTGRRADPRYGTTEKEHHMMFICPEHAASFQQAGWGKTEIREAMFRKARMPFRELMLNKERKALTAAHPELEWLWDSPSTMVPVLEEPGCFDIAVVGGPAGRGALFYGAGEPVTHVIQP